MTKFYNEPAATPRVLKTTILFSADKFITGVPGQRNTIEHYLFESTHLPIVIPHVVVTHRVTRDINIER